MTDVSKLFINLHMKHYLFSLWWDGNLLHHGNSQDLSKCPLSFEAIDNSNRKINEDKNINIMESFAFLIFYSLENVKKGSQWVNLFKIIIKSSREPTCSEILKGHESKNLNYGNAWLKEDDFNDQDTETTPRSNCCHYLANKYLTGRSLMPLWDPSVSHVLTT